MSVQQASLLDDFVERRRKLIPSFNGEASDTGVYVVVDGKCDDPTICAAIDSGYSPQDSVLAFGQTRFVRIATGSSVRDVLVVGTGGAVELTALQFESLGGSCYSALALHGMPPVSWVLDFVFFSAKEAAHFVFGVVRRSYDTDGLTRTGDNTAPSMIAFTCAQYEEADQLYRMLSIQCNAIDIARDLVNAPPNYSTPPIIVDWFTNQSVADLSTTIIEIDESTEQQFPGTAAVGRSSIEKPSILMWEWRGPNGDLDIETALLGKGITFDAGGLSLKPHDHQFHMKTDLGGAAAVAGAMHCIARNKLSTGVVGLIALAENLPGPNAVRPGDVLTMANGSTVEISFPDAEGRLVLSDLLVYAEQQFSPRFMIDVATLTGTVVAALGTETLGCFCPDAELRSIIEEAAKTSGEPVWQLPVGPSYLRSLESGIAFLKNMPAPGRMGILEGSASVAASFLQTFVQKSQWAHLDIAGTVWRSNSNASGPVGATGSGARLLYEIARQGTASGTT